MKKVYLSLGLISLVLFFSAPVPAQEKPALSDEQKLLQAMHLITSQDLYGYVDKLASPEFAGRLSGHVGYDKSAAWVIERLKEWGIKPLGSDGGYLQKFPHAYTDVLDGCYVKLHCKQKNGEIFKDYIYVDDYIPGATSGNGEIKAEAVFVGYGISAPELGYDDYAAVNVKGKIVVMNPEVPLAGSHQDFLKWRKYSFHQYKLLNAVKHGAAGLLYNYGPIGNPNNAYVDGFLYAHVGKTVMADLFAGTGRSLDEVFKKIKARLKPRSFATGKVFSIKNVTRHHADGTTANVIGYIEGCDPLLKNEYIMVGGHLDFLGKCPALMPGANDNATAVAVTLGVARALSKLDLKLKRSVVFLLIAAEEAGLRGVQYFLKHPTIPLDQIKGFINMDSVGNGHSLWVGFARNYPDLYSFLEQANRKYIHRELEPAFSENLTRPRQDAVFFDYYGIPVVSFGSFGDAGGAGTYRYHTPYDNIGNITPEIMEDLSQLLFMAIANMARQDNLAIKRGKGKPELLKQSSHPELIN
ncbi:MAG: M20/M25/M40 family metallo-hydrolase [Candidatus Aminicenantes bacterium]|nr:M20/M25/M40 family metallo-hydrolase [Candidatus Aminicenantes bacterium]